MSSILYIYDGAQLVSFREKFEKFDFYSIGQLFYEHDSIESLDNMESEKFEQSIIDLSNLIKDQNFNRYFFEIYILKLFDKVSNIHFCINYGLYSKFLETFPYIFDDEHINWDFHKKLENNNVLIKNEKEVYTYKKEYNGIEKIVSLSNLVDDCDGFSIKFDIEKIYNFLDVNNISYIDISSSVRMLKLRQDLIFQFEILFNRILENRKIRYCIEQDFIEVLHEALPFWNVKELIICDQKVNEIDNNLQNDIENISSLSKRICEKLKGHDRFKEDFERNFLKFFFLNQMGEQKILSILLCGDSGIGKTQFAKIVSKEMYPEEQLIKINFGNYSTEGVLNSLIGSPLGYVGSEEGGELLNKMTTSKTKVILIDEFEKATSSVYNFFYELLEDGVFTDRHGVEHDLDGYIIVFTSNMTSEEYSEKIPDSLKSRFNMVYYFMELSTKEKIEFINFSANELISKLEDQFEKKVDFNKISIELQALVRYKNLRNIKKYVEDIVFDEFYDLYKSGKSE